MDLGRGFSIPLEKGVSQNGNNWIPSTPDKPVLQSSNNAQSESAKENWNDLVGFCEELLSNNTPHKFDLNRTVDVNYWEHNNQGVAPVEIYNRPQQDLRPTGIVGGWVVNGQDVAPVDAYNKLPLNFSPIGCTGVNNMEHSIQDVSVLQSFGSLSQNAGRIGSYMPNSGEVVAPQKVSSLAELMGMRSALRDPPSNESPNRSNYYMGNPTIICPIAGGESNPVGYASAGARFQQNHIFHESNQLAYAMVGAKLHQNRALHESNQVDYTTVGAQLQQSHILHASHDDRRYNLQEMPNSRLSVPNYNLCIPPISEAGEPSSGARPLPLGPVTPDQQSKTQQTIHVPHLLIEETSTQEKYTKDNAVSFPEPQHLERDHSNILPNSVGTSIAETSTSPKERNIFYGGNGGIDLNTTPQQKTPKRRKHRPKVVVEGKPKRSPKPAATKDNTPEGNPPTKRNYVRKNGSKNSTPPSTDAVKVGQEPDLGPATKSCKRKLNFDLDNGAEKESKSRGLDYQEHNIDGSKLLDLNLDFHNAECSTELNGPSTSVLKAGQQNTYGQQKQQKQTACSFVHSTNKILPQESMPLVTPALPPASVDHALNIIARNLNVRNASINQHTDYSKWNQVHHHTTGSHAQLVYQASEPNLGCRTQSAVQTMPQVLEDLVNVSEKHGPEREYTQLVYQASEPNLGCRTQSAVQTMPQVLEDLVNVSEKHGPEREYTHTMVRNPHTIALMGSQVWSCGVSEAGNRNRESSSLWQNASGMHKNKNVEDNFRGTSSSMHSGITTVEDFQRRMNKSFPAQSSTVHPNGELENSDYRRQTIYSDPNSKSTKVTCYMNYPDVRLKFHQQHASSQVDLYSARMASKTSHESGNMQIIRNLAALTNWNLESASHGEPKLTPIDKNTNSPVRIPVKRTAGQTTSKKVPLVDKILQKEPKNKRSYGHSSKKVAGVQEERRNLCSIDYITKCMRDLQITEEQRALVPYRGDGALVPYEEFDRVKKKQPRPRVDLDPETNRLWNLLMGKQGDESSETMDAGKEKWWEEERKVFRGRVDSFIARMHLVQGDRRFSKWKGSVVDSVIGVFLTQNVSDHLSSSAFMSLAAKFPVRSTTVRQPCRENGGSSSVEHHDVRITYPDGTTFHHKMVKEPVYGHSSVISTDTSEDTTENVMPEKGTFLMNDHARRTEEDIISSQSSSESFVLQASEDIRSSSGSNSETEGGWNLCRNLEHVSVSEQAERIAALQQNQFGGSSNSNQRPLTGHQHLGKAAYMQNPVQAGTSTTNPHPIIPKVQHYHSSALQSSNVWLNMSMVMHNLEDVASLGKERTSTWASKDSDITNLTGAECMPDYIGQSAESAFMGTQDGRPNVQPSSVNHAVLDKFFELQTDSLDESHKRNAQHLIKQMSGKQEVFHQESTLLIDPRRPAEAFSKQQDKSKHMEVGTEMRFGQSSDEPSSNISTTISNARKLKAEKEKIEPFNWDTLRKQVQSKTGIRERSKDSMDSLDYDALLKADVREISDTIKERGMNNMLAERMKDFLNRLVQDHEKVDLEWLRDVEPDKAKDYLLSIRGIGLKSVECVRLLTLHHLAFPVDTNVGRIAVRLGWVPLQPLPESLQLHLLELYPVLESIQKYLWPRLCKLDQETLYELHYQMITFGKVFCTKREPNCNACPMRGECRHFASAFASARLSLPGPQERHIVSSTAPISANKSPDVIIKPMLLPPSEDNIGVGKGLTRECEPLIEEPTTPDSPTEVAERDIEDAFYEDPDEIPVIKLDVEEFTTNLQSFMQEQMEMGVGDMSKALVALSPELASLPIPKLKNISRLRTEHQVYQLPDSHPLLKGMDRREPDDPSPYLLAIWTPGETADSIQPPQSNCSSMEGGGLCNNTTCFPCNSTREAQAQTVRGTILIPCRTAMRGSFPLNGTYFQVNEVFADHESSLNPIDVPRNYLWNLPRRTVFFGTSVTSIFKGLSTEGIQFCFWKGFVCVRGFDQKTRAPRPLKARLHFPASKMAKQTQ